MKSTLAIVASMTLTLALGSVAGAAGGGPAHGAYKKAPQAKPAQVRPVRTVGQKTQQALVRARNIVGKKVQDSGGRQLGRLENLAVDSKRGQIAFAVLKLDSWLGKGANNLVAVPFAAIESPAGRDFLVSKVAEAQLKKAQGFSVNNYPNLSTQQWAQRIDEEFGYQPYWKSQYQPQGETTAPPRARPQAWLKHQGLAPKRIQTLEQAGFPCSQVQQALQQAYENKGMTQRQAVEKARQMSGEFQRRQMIKAHQQQTERNQMPAGHEQAAAYQPQIERLDQLMNSTVQNPQEQKLGVLKDLVIDMREGRIVYAIVQHGGILGLGSQLAAVPYSAVKLEPARRLAIIDATPDTLDRVSFKSGNWPDLTSEQWARRVHRQFNQEPYWQVYGYGFYVTPETISFSGTITSVQRTAAGYVQATVHTAAGRTHIVDLGPRSYLEQHDFSITRGESIDVSGFETRRNGQTIFEAQKMTHQGESIELRNRQGRPLWKQPPQPERQKHQKKQQHRKQQKQQKEQPRHDEFGQPGYGD